MTVEKNIKPYRDRLRILLILYYFADDCQKEDSNLVKLLKDEVRIQKIDFLIRYPDYFAYELLELATIDNTILEEVKLVVKEIFNDEEPTIRKDEMERFFFGAWESIDDVIAFLISRKLVYFESRKHTDMKVGQKYYYLTKLAVEKIQNNLSEINSVQWYINRCELIKKYFGDFSGKDLRVNQYKHPEYKNTPLKEYIKGIENKVKIKFNEMYNEKL